MATACAATTQTQSLPMKRILLVTTLTALVGVVTKADDAAAPITNTTTTTAPENNTGGRFGAGLILGEPTGASLKYWLNSTLAIDGAFGWSFHEETDLHLHGDFLWHKFDLIPVPKGEMPLYIGVGGRWKIRDDQEDRVGLRIPVGVSYIFENAPVDVFLEVAPVIDFTPTTRGSFTAGVGARFWF